MNFWKLHKKTEFVYHIDLQSLTKMTTHYNPGKTKQNQQPLWCEIIFNDAIYELTDEPNTHLSMYMSTSLQACKLNLGHPSMNMYSKMRCLRIQNNTEPYQALHKTQHRNENPKQKGGLYICLSQWDINKCVLFISYMFVKGFLAITFLLLAISSRNFQDVCQRFLYNQEQNFCLIRQKTKIFPIDPHYIKIAHFCNVMSIDMTLQKWAIFIMGI